MRLLFTALACLIFVSVLAQPYLDQTSTWIVSASVAPPIGFYTSTTEYNIDESIIFFNTNWYFQIYYETTTIDYPIGGVPITTINNGGPIYLREDEFKWYLYNTVTQVDDLLCDFDLSIGDNISTFTATSFLKPAPEIVDITYVTLFGSIIRKRFHLDNGFSFVEGVGNLAGLFSPYAGFIEAGTNLDCYTQNGQNWGLGPDSLCSSGTLSNIIFEETVKNELLKVTDLTGREVNPTTNQILFHIYDDGSVEKKFIVE